MRTLTTALALVLAGSLLHAEDTPPAGGDAKPSRENMKAMNEKAFTDADKNTDGKLDRAEFEVAAAAITAARAERIKATGRPVPPPPTAEVLDAAFKKGDANADSTLDKEEFGAALKALRPPRKDKGAEGAPPAEGAAPTPPPAP